MDKSKVYGLIMCVAAAVVGWIFLSGIVRGNYWAMAIPVFVALAAICILTFWIGWTIVMTKSATPSEEEGLGTVSYTSQSASPKESTREGEPSEGAAPDEGKSDQPA